MELTFPVVAPSVGSQGVASRSPNAVSTSNANLSSCRLRSTRSRRYLACTWDAARLAACLTVCLPTTTTSFIDEDSHSPTPCHASRAVITSNTSPET